MTDPVLEQLSRWAAGDLSEDEAEALARRVDTEPEVASAWAEMQAVVGDLDALAWSPERVGSVRPPAVDPGADPVRVPAAANHGVGWGWAMAAVAMVALGVGAWWVPSEPEVVLMSGETLVDGELQLLAGDLSIDLDGRAAIFVEPVEEVMRGTGRPPQEDPMNTQTLIAGLAGAAVTVVVYQGSAFVTATEGQEPVEVVPGQPARFQAKAPEAPSGVPSTPGPARDDALEARVEALNAELASIEQELAAERFGAAVMRGQLKAEQGAVSEWPAEASPALSEDALRDTLVGELGNLDGFSVSELDCYEFPCIVALRYDGDDDTLEWGAPVGDTVSAWADERIDQANVSMNQSIFRDDEGPEARFVLFAVDDGSGGDGVSERTKWRMGDLSERLGDDAQAAEGQE